MVGLKIDDFQAFLVRKANICDQLSLPISEAKALLHNKIAPGKRFIKRKGVGKARETLKGIHDMS